MTGGWARMVGMGCFRRGSPVGGGAGGRGRFQGIGGTREIE